MKRTILALLPLTSLLILAACLPLAAPPVYPTDTPTPASPTETPTPTIVWFPPTPTNTLMPMPVVTPTLDLRPQFGEMLFADDFTQAGAWTLGKSPTGSAALGKSELTLAISQPGGYLHSLNMETTLGDFYAEITASPSICRGEDEYGLLLRVSPSEDFYRFSVTCNGQARLDKFYNGRASSPQPLTMSGSIPPGAPSSSRLAVWAVGREMRFYANGEFLFTLNDPSLPSGGLGVFARSAEDTAVTVNFTDLQVYQVTE